jgi:hypothetical protein
MGCCWDWREPTVLQYVYNSNKTAICKTGKCDIAKTSYGNATIQEVVEANDNLKISKPCKKRKLTWPLDLYL